MDPLRRAGLVLAEVPGGVATEALITADARSEPCGNLFMCVAKSTNTLKLLFNEFRGYP